MACGRAFRLIKGSKNPLLKGSKLMVRSFKYWFTASKPCVNAHGFFMAYFCGVGKGLKGQKVIFLPSLEKE